MSCRENATDFTVSVSLADNGATGDESVMNLSTKVVNDNGTYMTFDKRRDAVTFYDRFY